MTEIQTEHRSAASMKKTIDDIRVHGQRVLVRLDFNVPLDEQQHITDDRRIKAAIPTIQHLRDGGGRLILMSHLGRPTGEPEDQTKFSLAPVAKRLGELLGCRVPLIGSCLGEEAEFAVSTLKHGEVCLLENLRFHAEETIKDKKALTDGALRRAKDGFASQIASLGDVYVCDAFGTCHRDNASMLTVPSLMAGKPRVVGYLVQREIEFLGGVLSRPARPFVCILGGAKVSDKLGVIHALLEKCDTILIGGAMAYTFLAAEGMDVGNSLVEKELFDTALNLRKEAGDRLQLPIDSVAAQAIEANSSTRVCETDIPNGWMGLDIGPNSIEKFGRVLQSAKTIVWNGPMGVFEVSPFDAGTLGIARCVAEATDGGATSIIGGGDSAAAIDQAGVADRMTHISTGGGASLEFLEGKRFAAIEILDD